MQLKRKEIAIGIIRKHKILMYLCYNNYLLFIVVQGAFPGNLQLVLVLKPSRFFQKTIADIGIKLHKEDFKMKVPVSMFQYHDKNCQPKLHILLLLDERFLLASWCPWWAHHSHKWNLRILPRHKPVITRNIYTETLQRLLKVWNSRSHLNNAECVW